MFRKGPTIADLIPEGVSAEERAEIMALAGRLREKRLLGYLKALQSNPCDAATIRALTYLLQVVDDALWRERILAASILGNVALTAEQKEMVEQALSSVLKSSPELRYKRGLARLSHTLFHSIYIWATIGAGSTFLFTFIGAFGWGKWPENGLALITSLFIGGMVGGVLGLCMSLLTSPISLSVTTSRSDRIRLAAATTLVRLSERVNALALAAMDRNPRVRATAVQKLQFALSALTEEDYGQLESEAVPNLCCTLEMLSEQFHPTAEERLLERSLLESLEKFGDGRAVKTVKRLAEEGPTFRNQGTAKRLLPILLERQRQEAESKTLLRGAESPVTTSEQLLRPAMAKVTEPPAELLRPTQESAQGVSLS